MCVCVCERERERERMCVCVHASWLEGGVAMVPNGFTDLHRFSAKVGHEPKDG